MTLITQGSVAHLYNCMAELTNNNELKIQLIGNISVSWQSLFLLKSVKGESGYFLALNLERM